MLAAQNLPGEPCQDRKDAELAQQQGRGEAGVAPSNVKTYLKTQGSESEARLEEMKKCLP